jgi:hypothetical protein
MVGDALDDWLATGLSGRSDRTRELYRDTVKPLRERLGEVKLRELTAGDVQETLDALAARLSTRSLQITRLCLERAIRHAEVRDLVGRNVAALIKAPAGRAGRPAKSLTLEQAQDLLRAAAGSRLYAYVVLSVCRLPGISGSRGLGHRAQAPATYPAPDCILPGRTGACHHRGEEQEHVITEENERVGAGTRAGNVTVVMHVPGRDQRRDVTAVQGALGGQAQVGPAVLMADRVPPRPRPRDHTKSSRSCR